MAQPLGKRIQEWFRNLPVVGEFLGYQLDYQQRKRQPDAAIMRQVVASFKAGRVGQGLAIFLVGAWKQLVGGADFPVEELEGVELELAEEVAAFKKDPSVYLADKLHALGSAEATREISQVLGGLVMDPVIGLFESYAKDPEPDVHEFSRSFHGYMLALSWGGGILDSVLKVGLGDRAPSVKDALSQMYWSMGLGFLGWQTLAPLLSAGLQPNLTRYYNRLYTPTRFTPSQAADVWALGERDDGWMREYLTDQGWRPEDIDIWLKLSYRTLSEGVLWDLYHEGHIGKPEMDMRLRSLGYDPADIPSLYLAHEKEDVKEADRFLLSTVKRAFRDGRMDETEFRAILGEQGYLPKIVDLLVEQLVLDRQEEVKELNISQVRTLYNGRQIGRDEAVHYLTAHLPSAELAEKMVSAWDQAALPKPARINTSTILEGFVDGVLTRAEAKALLIEEAGYPPDKAELIIKIEEAGVPEVVTAPEVAAASLSMLAGFVAAGLITRAELEIRAELERFSPEDRERIIELMYLQEPEVTDVAELPMARLESAYVFGIISRADLVDRLMARGLTPDDAEIQVAVLEAQHPEVFGPEVPVYLRQPSVGAIQLALQRGLIDEAGFRARLEAQGYSQDAIDMFLFNAQFQAPAEPRQPSKADVTRWLSKQVIGRAEFQRRMIQIGYTATDIQLYLQDVGLAVEDTQAAEWLIAGLLDLAGFAVIVEELGFTPEEIDEFLTRFAAGEFTGI